MRDAIGKPLLRQGVPAASAAGFAAAVAMGGLPVLHAFYTSGWIAAHWYHPAFAVLCLLPAAVAHGAAVCAGARGTALWLAWLPGIAVYAAFPWPEGGAWRPIWIFGHAWDWTRTVFRHHDTAGPFALNSLGAFLAVTMAAGIASCRLWMGAAKAFGRTGSDVLGPGEAGDALPGASWASRSETARRFSAPGGIVLGELTDPVRDSPRFSPDRRRTWGRQGRGRLITMDPRDGNGHVLVTSQASGYKSTGLVIPNILTYSGPLVVFDPKCELYARTRKARERMGFTPVAVDGRNGFDPARLIAALAVDHPSAYVRMAKMMIPKGHSGIENAQYFRDAATNLFTALLAYFGETGSLSILQDIARVLARSPDEIHAEVERKLEDSRLPFVRNQLGALEGMDPRFWYSVKTEITNQLLFGEMPDIERYITMEPDSRLPSQVIDPECDIFLNIPQHVAEDFAPMLRLMLGAMLTAAQLVEVNEAPRARRLFLIDEAAKLGAMDILENIRDRGRSLGLHLMMFYQTPGEIERLWGRAGMTSWRDGCSATVMGPVSSRTSAQDISAMVGTRTLRVMTESRSTSSQVMSPMAGSVSASEQEQLRDVPLISPTAVSQLPRHASVITSPGTKPVLASKAIWFTRDDMKGRVRSTGEIAGDLEVTGSREALTKRLAAMSRKDGGTAGTASAPPSAGPSPAATPPGGMNGHPAAGAPPPDPDTPDAPPEPMAPTPAPVVPSADGDIDPGGAGSGTGPHSSATDTDDGGATVPETSGPDGHDRPPPVVDGAVARTEDVGRDFGSPAPTGTRAESAEPRTGAPSADGPAADMRDINPDGARMDRDHAPSEIDGSGRSGDREVSPSVSAAAHEHPESVAEPDPDPGPGDDGGAWTAETNVRVVLMLRDGIPPGEIARAIGRDPDETLARIRRMRSSAMLPEGTVTGDNGAQPGGGE